MPSSSCRDDPVHQQVGHNHLLCACLSTCCTFRNRCDRISDSLEFKIREEEPNVKCFMWKLQEVLLREKQKWWDKR